MFNSLLNIPSVSQTFLLLETWHASKQGSFSFMVSMDK